jgi:hypothetical protein
MFGNFKIVELSLVHIEDSCAVKQKAAIAFDVNDANGV